MLSAPAAPCMQQGKSGSLAWESPNWTLPTQWVPLLPGSVSWRCRHFIETARLTSLQTFLGSKSPFNHKTVNFLLNSSKGSQSSKKTPNITSTLGCGKDASKPQNIWNRPSLEPIPTPTALSVLSSGSELEQTTH